MAKGNGKRGNGGKAANSKGSSHSAEHLKPYAFKPGQSGNLRGRPSGPSPTKRAIELLTMSPAKRKALEKKLGQKIPTLDQIIVGWLEECVGGDMQAVRELLNRFDGKVPDKIDVRMTMRAEAERIASEYDGVTADELLDEAERLIGAR